MAPDEAQNAYKRKGNVTVGWTPGKAEGERRQPDYEDDGADMPKQRSDVGSATAPLTPGKAEGERDQEDEEALSW